MWVTNIFGKKNPSSNELIGHLKNYEIQLEPRVFSAWSPYPLRSSAAALVYVSSGPHV